MPKHKKPTSAFTAFTMVDISLNCRLFRDIEENYTFTIVVNTANSIENFKKDIKEQIKQTGNDIFDGIDTDHLILWQVCASNSEFSTLTLEMKNKNVKKLEGIIGDYWTKQPLKEFTQVIVDSPYLTILRKLNSLTMLSQDLNPTNISLQQLYNEQYIKQGNILLYDRTYKNVKFTRKFKIKDIYNTRKLLVILTSAENKETLMLFGSLSELELYILKSDACFKDITWVTGSAYDWFFIIDEGVNKGSITELRRQYVEHKTINLTEEVESQKKLNMRPKKLGEHQLLPILDPTRSRLLKNVKKKFLMEFKKKVPFYCVCEGVVNNREVIVAFVDQPEEEPVHLPAEFEGFRVLISYKALILYYHLFHKDLMLGISLGNLDEPLNANTHGPLFQNNVEPNKTFILTAKHAVGKEGEDVNVSVCAKVTKYNFIGADSACNYIDYAFCETVEDREIPEIPNVSLGEQIQIRTIKTSVNDNTSYVQWAAKSDRPPKN
ncbi:hypothetical protein C1646_760836 [Rhizophagus diaphanus]|nr:hypothetical protein C1646_760836 [Rhizophagus diaphanus] [Rhizophagus sp. MUCL 43196]